MREQKGRKAFILLSDGVAFRDPTSKKDSMESIYGRIEEELRNQYSIGYTPARKDTTGKYRKIKLTTKPSGLIVQARDGYYPR
jgi:hypothetical protein